MADCVYMHVVSLHVASRGVPQSAPNSSCTHAIWLSRWPCFALHCNPHARVSIIAHTPKCMMHTHTMYSNPARQLSLFDTFSFYQQHAAKLLQAKKCHLVVSADRGQQPPAEPRGQHCIFSFLHASLFVGRGTPLTLYIPAMVCGMVSQ
jgi:hypothetical protein